MPNRNPSAARIPSIPLRLSRVTFRPTTSERTKVSKVNTGAKSLYVGNIVENMAVSDV